MVVHTFGTYEQEQPIDLYDPITRTNDSRINCIVWGRILDIIVQDLYVFKSNGLQGLCLPSKWSVFLVTC